MDDERKEKKLPVEYLPMVPSIASVASNHGRSIVDTTTSWTYPHLITLGILDAWKQ